MTFNRTTEGLIKAWGLIASALERRKHAQGIRRFYYEHVGSVVHAKYCLTESERHQIRALLEEFHAADDSGKAEIVSRLPHKKIRIVPVKREIRIDRSRYSPEDLRRIRARNGVGRPPNREIKDAA